MSVIVFFTGSLSGSQDRAIATLIEGMGVNSQRQNLLLACSDINPPHGLRFAVFRLFFLRGLAGGGLQS
jgi:hypothetical protein